MALLVVYNYNFVVEAFMLTRKRKNNSNTIMMLIINKNIQLGIVHNRNRRTTLGFSPLQSKGLNLTGREILAL